MKMPTNVKPWLQGAAGGVVITLIVGFGFSGWMLEGSAKKLAFAESQKAVVATLAPACAKSFMAQPDAAVKRVALEKASSYGRKDLFDQSWVSLPGQSYPDNALVEACSALVLKGRAV